MMIKKEKQSLIINGLNDLFPDAHCELDHKNNFELLVAVVLSAQTTDKKVNSVTPALFSIYPDAVSLMNGNLTDIEAIIKPIGLYKNKSRNIVSLSKELVERFDGLVPDNRDDLESLPGVGRKTANVILSNCFDIPAFAVDTHVHRVSKRLGIAKKDDDVNLTEKKLMKFFPKEMWGKLHHQFIFFGRYQCTSQKPSCEGCPFKEICRKDYL